MAPMIMSPRYLLARLRNSARTLLAGLPRGGERVWEGVRTDLFEAHRSIYLFFSRFAFGKHVLDAGCGSGYGSRMLLDAGARSVHGFDIDTRAIAFATKRYSGPGLTFKEADCSTLTGEASSFDLIVSSNMVEHLPDPAAFVRSAKQRLTSTGALIVAVPPITNEVLQADNEANPFHLANLTVDEWLALFRSVGVHVRCFRHTHPKHAELDFGSPHPSRFPAEEFTIEETDRDGLYGEQTLTAIFHLQSATNSGDVDASRQQTTSS